VYKSQLWPLISSAAAPGIVTLQTGALDLPVLREGPWPLRTPLPAPEDLPNDKSHSTLSAPALERWQTIDQSRAEIGWRQAMTKTMYHDTQTVFGYETQMIHVQERSPVLQERVTVSHMMCFERPDGVARIPTDLTAQSPALGPRVTLTLSATWNDTEIATRTWRIPDT